MLIESWAQCKIPKEKPYLILGKGPSLAKVFDNEKILQEFNTVALNHAGLFFDCNYVHFIDMDIPYAYRKNQNFICPWHPHVNFRASKYTLEQYKVTVLEKSTYYWYNCSTWKVPRKHKIPVDPIIQARLFSAESVFQLLYHKGITDIHTAGIDGGSEYHPVFTEIGLKPLQNTQPSFDKGLLQLDKLCLQLKLNWVKL